MIAAAHIDVEQEVPDRVLAELDAMREQLNAIEAALPDYGPSFSALEQQTQQITASVDRIAASPSVKLSAEQHAAKSGRAISDLLAPSIEKLNKAIEYTEVYQTKLIDLTNTLHVRSMHRPFPWVWPTVALIAGFWLYPLMAATIPGGSHLAAITTGHRSSWVAGGSLMQAHNPEGWTDIVRASRLFGANESAFKRCAEVAFVSKMSQPCVITVSPAGEPN